MEMGDSYFQESHFTDYSRVMVLFATKEFCQPFSFPPQILLAVKSLADMFVRCIRDGTAICDLIDSLKGLSESYMEFPEFRISLRATIANLETLVDQDQALYLWRVAADLVAFYRKFSVFVHSSFKLVGIDWKILDDELNDYEAVIIRTKPSPEVGVEWEKANERMAKAISQYVQSRRCQLEKCELCGYELASVFPLPCSHAVYCADDWCDAVECQDELKICPICSKPIEKYIRL
jgi:hypothetical protein